LNTAPVAGVFLRIIIITVGGREGGRGSSSGEPKI